ncbi:hypothetical protein MYX78_06305, partial [Acidobacteria bacterium AH-259-G07]|nr:hypothetical protein [Acidobacteria bacterium AH-259-G07]
DIVPENRIGGGSDLLSLQGREESQKLLLKRDEPIGGGSYRDSTASAPGSSHLLYSGQAGQVNFLTTGNFFSSLETRGSGY